MRRSRRIVREYKQPGVVHNTTSGSSSKTARTAVSVVPSSRDTLPLSRLPDAIESFLIVGDLQYHSQATLTNYRYRLSRLTWLAEHQSWKQVGHAELLKFFLYLNHGHKEKGGRWGNPQQTEQLSPGSAKTFHVTIRTFFRWLVKEGEIDVCPLDKLPVPIHRADQVQPFSEPQVNALLAASKKTLNKRRNEAIVWVLYDCGLRVTELCSLKVKNISFSRGEITVEEGKGGMFPSDGMRSVLCGHISSMSGVRQSQRNRYSSLIVATERRHGGKQRNVFQSGLMQFTRSRLPWRIMPPTMNLIILRARKQVVGSCCRNFKGLGSGYIPDGWMYNTAVPPRHYVLVFHTGLSSNSDR